jgi:hypothetical protein
MPFSSGDPAAHVALGMQSALGSPQATPAKFRFLKQLAGTDVDPDATIVKLREGGDGLDYGFIYKQKQVARGQIVVNARPEGVGQILSVLPAGATWDGGSAPAIHTFMTGHASHPWSTLQIGHPATSIIHNLSDVRFSGVTIEANAGDPWRFSLPFVAITHGASGVPAGAPTYYGDDPFLFHTTPSYIIDGTADSDITGFTFNLSLGLDELQSQAITLDEIPVMNRETTLEIRRRYESPTLWQKIAYGGGVTPTTSVATGSFEALVTYGTGANKRLLRMYLPLLGYKDDKLTELDPDGKTVTETIAADVLKGATHAAIFQLQNAHASVYGS